MVLRRRQLIIYVCVFIAFAIFFGHIASSGNDAATDLEQRKINYPKVSEHIHMSSGRGGAWYIPPDWLSATSVRPANITHAAYIARTIANGKSPKHLANSTIPLIIHQTWKSTRIELFPNGALPGIESWIEYATNPELPSMAYFMWDNEGVMDLMTETEPDLLHYFELLPDFVEKADIFRIVVCNSIGGLYADIDTRPQRHPSAWVDQADIQPWVDRTTHMTFGLHENSSQPVGLILGIEADTDEESDSFWRMGYTYPVQLTQWVIASAPNHVVMTKFLQDFRMQMKNLISQAVVLNGVDPLELTGPAAITKATKDYLTEKAGLRWHALSGLKDGGRSKLVLDILILPITGFSPGRGFYGNMGSKPFSHPDARARHDAQGSWRKFDVTVELGKVCRTVLGHCRHWSKVPQRRD